MSLIALGEGGGVRVAVLGQCWSTRRAGVRAVGPESPDVAQAYRSSPIRKHSPPRTTNCVVCRVFCVVCRVLCHVALGLHGDVGMTGAGAQGAQALKGKFKGKARGLVLTPNQSKG